MSDKNTNYIFTFGAAGTGKSTMLAAITQYMMKHPSIQLIQNTKNPEGFRLLTSWVKSLMRNEFPNRTLAGDIIEMDVALKDNTSNRVDPLTILEMSGESLTKQIDEVGLQTNNTKVQLDRDHQQFLSNASVIFLVTSTKQALEDDVLIWTFLQIIQNEGIQTPIALIITKWDEVPVEYRRDVKSFAKDKLKFTYNTLINLGEYDLFKFSVGEREFKPTQNKQEDDGYEGVLNKPTDDYCEDVVVWMYDNLLVFK